MIPIRNFPYTDYHDLNLDWLLRQLQIWEVDLDELKRRVKALEDWRTDTVDPDLRDIKLTIIDIQGDIRSLGDRVTIVEGDITTLAGNNEVYEITISETDITIKDDINGNTITDLYNFFNRLRNSRTSTLGKKNIELIGKYTSTKGSLDYSIVGSDPFMVDLTIVGNGGTSGLSCRGCNFYVSSNNEISFYNLVHASGRLVSHDYELQFTSSDTFVSNTDPDTSSTYPYYVRKNYFGVNENSSVNAVFKTLKENITYSDIVSDYIRTNDGTIDIFFTRQLVSPEAFYLVLDSVK